MSWNQTYLNQFYIFRIKFTLKKVIKLRHYLILTLTSYLYIKMDTYFKKLKQKKSYKVNNTYLFREVIFVYGQILNLNPCH
jgi:hypothetical protein